MVLGMLRSFRQAVLIGLTNARPEFCEEGCSGIQKIVLRRDIKMKRKVFIIIGIAFTVLLVAALVLVFGFWFMFGGGSYFIQVPKPEIPYGEFPFRLTYELNGEIKVIEDTIICEFDGFKVEGESGKYRKWKTRLKSGRERITLLDVRQLGEMDDFNRTILELFFSYGNGEYYMGDEYRRSEAKISTYVEYMYQNIDGTTGGSAFSAEEAYEKYKIKLISWEPALPIQNSFK